MRIGGCRSPALYFKSDAAGYGTHDYLLTFIQHQPIHNGDEVQSQ